MAYKNGIYEIAQDVKFNWAEGPVATGEMDLCFPQCTATETHWSCVQSLWDPTLLKEPWESHQWLSELEEETQSMQGTPIPGLQDLPTLF